MRVLLDENLPVELIGDFNGHECAHVVSIGWAGTQNGDLLAKAESAGFNVLLTLDSGIPKQHDLSRRSLAVVLVKPEGQGPASVRALVEKILVALDSCKSGEVITVSNRRRAQP